jgi:hypothetical protein
MKPIALPLHRWPPSPVLGALLAAVLGVVAGPRAAGAGPTIGGGIGERGFSLVFSDGRVIRSGELQETAVDATHRLFAETNAGLEASETLIPQGPGRPYCRCIVEVKNTGAGDLALSRIVLLDVPSPEGARVVGRFPGSPVVAGSTFCGVEHPLADNRVSAGRIQCALPLMSPLRPRERVTASLVIGAAAEAPQLRRAFLGYIEAERARPYAPFLHHNTWYNIGYGGSFSEREELEIVAALGRELVEKRGVKLDGFVLDDGWDDTNSLWRFGPGWPAGLRNLTAAAARYGAAPGLWLSPWGGYGTRLAARLKAAAPGGFEIRDGRFSLAGPRYYERFRELCAGAVRDDGVVYFKFDGIGADATGAIDAASGRDFDAMLRLVRELRALRPGLYISQTTGTWPSPWWLFHVDNIWRGGDDNGFAGVGTPRQQWLTFRDGETYRNVVQAGPLYPLNSLMIHGILYSRNPKGLDSDPAGDFASEVRSYFGSGTQLQELYLSPELLTQGNWDDLAAAALWAGRNVAALRDTHWIGGDPGKLEVYGWAGWAPAKGVITLRNPSSKPATFSLDPGPAFELPDDAPKAYRVSGAYPDAPAPMAKLEAGKPVQVALKPFQVIVLDAQAAGP